MERTKTTAIPDGAKLRAGSASGPSFAECCAVQNPHQRTGGACRPRPSKRGRQHAERFPGLWFVLGAATFISATALLSAQDQPAKPPAGETPAATQPEKPAPEESPASQPTEPDDADRATSAPAREKDARGRSSKSASREPEPRREPSPSEILRELTKQGKSERPVIAPTAPGRIEQRTVSDEALPENAIRPPTRKLLPDGYRIVDRPGRLVREGDYWVFSFEDRGQGAPEPPIRLLPNRLLEDMERFSAGGTKPTVFVISGEATEYHNVNYLLLQKLLTRPDLGNLK